MTWQETAVEELKRAGLFEKNSDYGGMIGDAVAKLIQEFAAQGHSAASAIWTADIFHRLVCNEPLSPLTTDPEEWMTVSADGTKQNRRCSHVFMCRDGKAYTINGRVFEDKNGNAWTAQVSAVGFELPGFPPKPVRIKEGTPEAEEFADIFADD